MRVICWGAIALILGTAAISGAAVPPTFTVNDARTLQTSQLARELLGERLGPRVIEARRYEYEGSTKIPEYVQFFTQPELPAPVINRICRTDVITIEYNWFEHDDVNGSKPLKIARVAARSRYVSFQEPAGDPSSEEYRQAHATACANMTSASDAFRAPSGGDAQWLAAIHDEYSNPANRLDFSCKDYADRSCVRAREALRGLALNLARDVEPIDCPKVKTRDQVNYCYRLTFPYAPGSYPEIGDYADVDSNPEWVITVFAGMRDGMAPVRIRSLNLEHIEKPLAIP